MKEACRPLRVRMRCGSVCEGQSMRYDMSITISIKLCSRTCSDKGLDSDVLAAGEEPARVGPLYTPAQPIADVTPPTESLLIMTVSEEGYVWQWDMPLQV